MHRREFLANSTTLSASVALWGVLRASAADVSPKTAVDPLLDRVCDLVIPATDTPGAKAVGVARFISVAMAHGIAGTSPADLTQLEGLLRDASGGTSFLSLTPDEQLEVLTGVDQAGYAARGSLWSRLKGLVLIGYYTSQVGCTEELYYQLVPGRFDPDVPLKPGDRASANDWTGQRFG